MALRFPCVLLHDVPSLFQLVRSGTMVASINFIDSGTTKWDTAVSLEALKRAKEILKCGRHIMADLSPRYPAKFSGALLRPCAELSRHESLGSNYIF